MQQRGLDGQEVRVARVVDLDDAPRILPRADPTPANLHHLLRAHDRKGHEPAELGILLDGVLVVFFDVVGKVVHGNAVVFDVLHDEFLGLGELGWGHGVGFADDGDYVHAG